MTSAIRPLHLLLFVFVMAIWGMNFGVAKIGVAQIPPIFMMSLRFALAAAVLLPFVPLPRGHWREVALISVTFGLAHFSLMMTGLSRVDAAVAALTIQIQIPFAAILAAIFFKDWFGWRRTLGFAIAFAGVGLIAGEPRLAGNYVAFGMVVAAAFAWAVANIQIKMLDGVGGLSLSAWMAALATPQLFLASLILEEGQWAALTGADWRAWASLVYQSLAVFVLGYGIWLGLLRQYDVNQVMPFTLLVPLFGVLSGVLLLGESLSLAILGGGLLTILGVAIIVLRRPQVAGPETERV